jgi:hypothetical protein
MRDRPQIAPHDQGRRRTLNPPGVSGDFIAWEGWSRAGRFNEAVPAGAEAAGGADGRGDRGRARFESGRRWVVSLNCSGSGRPRRCVSGCGSPRSTRARGRALLVGLEWGRCSHQCRCPGDRGRRTGCSSSLRRAGRRHDGVRGACWWGQSEGATTPGVGS